MATLSGGEKVNAALERMAAKLRNPAELKVGFLEGATYPNGTPVAMVAAIQEFGAPRRSIPPRPFFRTMIAEKKGTWVAGLREILKQNDYDVKISLGLLGEQLAGDLRESIAKVTTPPLSPITLMLRKMQYEDSSLVVTGRTVGIAAARVAAGESTAGAPTKPLIWTGHLLNSVDYEVKE